MAQSEQPDAAERINRAILDPQTDPPFRCTACRASARFLPLYRFSKDNPAILLQHPATIRCGNCNQWYRWDGDGWARMTQLEDLELLGD